MNLTDLGFQIVWVILGVITTWRVVAMIRTPTPTPGRVAVTILFATAFVSNTFNRDVVIEVVDQSRLGLAHAISSIALICFFGGFVYFFATGLNRSSVMSSLALQAGIAGGWSLLLLGTWALTPPDVGMPSFNELGGQESPWPYAGQLVNQLFMLYALTASMVLAWRAGRGRPAGWKWAFRTCSVGMALCLVSGPLMRGPSLFTRWAAGQPLSPAFEGTRSFVNMIGIVLVLGGVFFLAARTSARRSVAQIAVKRRFLVLRPLWRILHLAYPAIALHPPRSFLAELFTFGARLRYRYRRRTVECRDGLWRLSPYVADPDDSESTLTIDEQARLVLDAIGRSHGGDGPVASAVAIAAPPETDNRPDADADQLVALSQAIRRHERARSSNASTATVVGA